ncbi:hypothetical protein [Lysinibacillus agricola]
MAVKRYPLASDQGDVDVQNCLRNLYSSWKLQLSE